MLKVIVRDISNKIKDEKNTETTFKVQEMLLGGGRTMNNTQDIRTYSANRRARAQKCTIFPHPHPHSI